MFHRVAIPVLGAVSGLLVLSTAATVWPDDFKAIPAASLKEEFNDNIFFSSASRSSFITTASAGLSLLENTERLTTKLDLRLDGLIYSADSSLNGLEQRYDGQARFLLTPLLRVGASAAFSRQSRPDRYVETTGLVVRQNSSHQEYGVTGDASLTEKATGQLAYSYFWADYHDPAVSNVAGHNLKGAAAYDLGSTAPLLKLRSVAGYNTYRYTASAVDNYSITVGAAYPFHELWAIQCDIGGRLTHAEFGEQTQVSSGTARLNRSSDSPGWIAALVASYRGETAAAALTLSRDLQNAAGRSSAVESTAVTLLLSRRFSYELAGTLEGGYYRNSSSVNQFSSQSIDDRTWRVNPLLRYEFSRVLALELSYEFASVQTAGTRTEAHRNKIFTCLTLRQPFFE